MLKISENLDLNISLTELIDYNETCKVNTSSVHHFETYEGILIYVSHPDNEEKFTIQLGVDESGIMYEGDYGCRESFKEIPIKEGIDILLKYRELIIVRNRLEDLFMDNKLDVDSVLIDIR